LYTTIKEFEVKAVAQYSGGELEDPRKRSDILIKIVKFLALINSRLRD
jgi:hypothetical protein